MLGTAAAAVVVVAAASSAARERKSRPEAAFFLDDIDVYRGCRPQLKSGQAKANSFAL